MVVFFSLSFDFGVLGGKEMESCGACFFFFHGEMISNDFEAPRHMQVDTPSRC